MRPTTGATLTFLLAIVEWEAGNLQTAERYIASVDEGEPEVDLWLTWSDALFATRRGRLDHARARAEETLELAVRMGDRLIAALPISLLAAIELWSGRPAEAHRLAHPKREAFLADGLGFVGSLFLGLWSCDIEALIAIDRREDAERVLIDLQQRARDSANPHAQAVAHRCAGLLLAARGDLPGAIAAMDAALDQHARRPLAPEIGRTLLEKGSLQRRAKRKSAAKQSLEQALELLEPIDASLWVNRARDELSRIGLRRASVSEGLTPAQTRVAELVASGLSNREIASKLYMSPRSVESHLTKVYREYGVRSRAQLVAALAARTSHG